jgi:signal transduction histidine kinase
MAILAEANERSRLRLLGRLAGVLLFGSGLVSLATVPEPAPDATNRPALVVITAVAMAIGILVWIAPWDRWNRRASLWLMPVAFGLIGAGNYYSADADPRAYGVFFVIAFVWLGVTHDNWIPTLMAPIAFGAYIIPILRLGEGLGAALSSASLTIPICVLTGEALAWGTAHLARTEAALREERENATRLRAMAEIRTTFMSAVSHELRTPITICRGHLEVMGRRPAPEELEETLDVVVDELTRMGRIVDDITTLVRVEDPAFLRPETIALDRFVHDVAVKAVPLLDGRLRLGPLPAESTITIDPQRLTQALINLLQNAAVHTPAAAPVDLRVRATARGWLFEVEDRGTGVPPGSEEDLFRPFRRGSTAAPGTGLGLAIVRGIAEAHGGAAGVWNRPGFGATFWMEIPA